MSPLQFKIFNSSGEYVAATRHAEEAVMLVSALGIDSEIRTGHEKRKRVWHEGHEAQSAFASYDYAANVVRERIENSRSAAYARLA